MITAENITVDDDEGRYILVIETEDGDRRSVDIHNIVLDFYAQVQKHIRPYVLEAESARRSPSLYTDAYNEAHGVPQPITNRPVSVEDAVEAGYALDDPKSPGYHDRMADICDNREGK